MIKRQPAPDLPFNDERCRGGSREDRDRAKEMVLDEDDREPNAIRAIEEADLVPNLLLGANRPTAEGNLLRGFPENWHAERLREVVEKSTNVQMSEDNVRAVVAALAVLEN